MADSEQKRQAAVHDQQLRLLGSTLLHSYCNQEEKTTEIKPYHLPQSTINNRHYLKKIHIEKIEKIVIVFEDSVKFH